MAQTPHYPISLLRTGTFFIKRTNPKEINNVTAVANGISNMGFKKDRVKLNPKKLMLVRLILNR